MANRCRRQLSFVLILFLSACATPDLQSFATQTANLAYAVNAEQATVSGKLEEIKALAKEGLTEGWGADAKGDPRNIGFDPEHYGNLRKQYDASAGVVSEVLLAATVYSQALVNLAATGEDGKEALKSVKDAMEGVTNAIGITNPAALLGKGANAAITEIVTIIGRIQSQESLRKIMGAVEEQDLTGRLAEAIKNIYGEVETDIIVNLAGLEDQLQRRAFGTNKRIAAILAMKANSERYKVLTIVLKADAKKSACQLPASGTPTAVELAAFGQNCFQFPEGLFDDNGEIDGLIADYKVHTQQLADIVTWRDLHIDKSKNIVNAVKAWAAEHTTVYTAIENCGGFRVLKKSCGQLTFANLTAAAKRVEGLAQGLNQDRKDETK